MKEDYLHFHLRARVISTSSWAYGQPNSRVLWQRLKSLWTTKQSYRKAEAEILTIQRCPGREAAEFCSVLVSHKN